MECESTDMWSSLSSSFLWNKIELAESFLVCCMYEEAASLAFSIEKLLGDVRCREIDDAAWCYSMMESAGIVLVQSWKELGRTGEIVDGLRRLHGSITNIPVSLLLTGVCFQLAEGCTHNLPEYLEAYLSAWRYVDGHYISAIEAGDEEVHFILECDKYFEVAETYIITLLEVSPNDVDNVISWVAKSILPEDKRQMLLERRVHCGCLAKPTDGHRPHPAGDMQQPEKQRAELLTNEAQGMISLRSLEPVTWVFPQLKQRFYMSSNGCVLFGCLMLLMLYIARRKRDVLKLLLRRGSRTMKKALIDLWQLAFSHQINPLAAVHPRSPLVR